MKLKLNTLLAVIVFLGAFLNKSLAQDGRSANTYPFHLFDTDSLRGFDEEAARRSAISENFLGAEFKVRMFQLKRKYINDKYNLWRPVSNQSYNNYAAKGAAVPGCVNEDFEASTAGTITTNNQILGWTVSRGTNNSSIVSGANSCNLLGCCTSAPQESAIFVQPNGLTDPIIGAQYKIYSVFGTSAGDAAAETANPQISQGLFGDNFIRINSDALGTLAYSIEKLSKTFAVTANNALFQFAFITVFSTGHPCCDAGAFQIRLTNATTNSVIACPNFSASAPSSQCTATNSVAFLQTTNGQPVSTNYNGTVFNKWKISSMDLSAYIGQNITIDILVSDCTASGHFGYVYFDAQCGPMVVYGNGISYAAGSGNITVPTCGASGASLCAAAGLGPYAWGGPNIPLNSGFGVPSFTNACFVTSLTAAYTLSMFPEGSCAAITRTINSLVTPAPGIFAGVTQAICGQNVAVVTVTGSGSSVNPAILTWSPVPLSLNSTTTTGTMSIPTGTTSVINVTITATDGVGCKASATVPVLPAPPLPDFTFSLSPTSISYSITCDNPVVDVNAATSYTYGNLDYFWSSPNSTFVTSNAPITLPGIYTVVATDPVTFCSKTKTLSVVINTTAPVTVVSPTNQSINCAFTTVSPVTLTATNPSVSVSHVLLAPTGGSLTSTSASMIYNVGGVGIHTCITTNDLNGCTTTKVFNVTSNDDFPTFALQSPQNYTLGCTTKSTCVLNIVGGQGTGANLGGPVSYTVIGPTTSSVIPSGTLNINNSYTITTPGTWTVVVADNASLCKTRLPISIIAKTDGPSLDALEIPTNILTCENPSVTLKASSLTNSVSYNWAIPGPAGNFPASTVVVNANFTVAQTQTVINIYTLTLTNDISTCKTTSTITMFQNLYTPNAVIANQALSPISCKTPSLTLTNQSTTKIPANSTFPHNLPVIGALWSGPSPQQSFSNTSTYVALVPGVFTMVARDANNGCESTVTLTVLDDRNFPNVNENDVIPDTVDCGRVRVIRAISVPTANVTYLWSAPEGGSYGGSNTTPSLTVPAPGIYNVLVTNTINGCATRTNVTVVGNTVINVAFAPSTTFGYAPLTVNFVNNSSTSSGTSSISSVWNFGNNTSATTASASISPSVTYNSPGTYTVTLYSASGTCLGSTTRTISVEIPSGLTVPNIFTPNGDGVNDVYFLKVTNLSQIKATIYDRWGTKVYEVDTQNEKNNAGIKENVNLAWDGKNQYGLELPQSSYFYVIKATGKDGKEYSDKGTITLVR